MKRAFAIAFPLLVSLLLFQLVSGSLSLVSAQTQHPNHETKSVDLEQLRRDFVAVVGKDFEVVKDELKGRSNLSGGGTYWLAHLKAKHTSTHTIHTSNANLD
jgi:membrane protein implicated in regulation of membrane protease activity